MTRQSSLPQFNAWRIAVGELDASIRGDAESLPGSRERQHTHRVSILLTVSRWTPERSARSRSVQSSNPRAALICALVTSTSPGRPESLGSEVQIPSPAPIFRGLPRPCPLGGAGGKRKGVSQRFGSRLNSGLAQSASRSYSNNDLAGRSISGGIYSSRSSDRANALSQHFPRLAVDPQLGEVISANLKWRLVHGQDQWCMCR